MPDAVHLIPLEAIADDALTRDRTALDPDALTELKLSILATGLRMPIELFELAEPRRPPPLRPHLRLPPPRRLPRPHRRRHPELRRHPRLPPHPRLHRRGHDRHGRGKRHPRRSLPLGAGHGRRPRHRIRPLRHHRSRHRRPLPPRHPRQAQAPPRRRPPRRRPHGSLTAPETLSVRQLLRLAAAASRGYTDLMRHALLHSSDKQPDTHGASSSPSSPNARTPESPTPAPKPAPATAPAASTT